MPRWLFVWDHALAAYQFGPDHPLNSRRLTLTLGLIRALGLLDGQDVAVAVPEPASDSDIMLVHEADYVAAVRAASGDEEEDDALRDPEDDMTGGALGRSRGGGSGTPADVLLHYGLGTDDVPIVAGMHGAAAHIAGATLTAARRVTEGSVRRAFNIAGGLHHAGPALASGFCVYNDLAIAIRWMQKKHGARVLYFDIDAHHGDGVQTVFYDDPNVLTVSFHESGTYLFPGTGFTSELGRGDGYGYSVNVPLDVHTTDDSFEAAFDALLPDIAQAFRPDVIVMQCGCDAHVLDPLTHLRCTTGLFERMVARTVDLAERVCQGRMIATGGGGYAIHTVVPRAWTLVWAALCGRTATDGIPRDWLEAVRRESGIDVPRTLRDPAGAFPPSVRAEQVWATNEQTIDAVRRKVLPLLAPEAER